MSSLDMIIINLNITNFPRVAFMKGHFLFLNVKVQILTVLKPEVQNQRFSILLYEYIAKYFIFGLMWISKGEVSSPSGSVFIANAY